MDIRFRSTVVALLLATLVAGGLALVSVAPWRSSPSAGGSLSGIWQAHLERAGVPGGAYAVVTSQGTRERASWGVDGTGRPWTAQTPALWGSVSKPVAASVAQAAIDRGHLRASDPITAHLSFQTCPAARRVTVSDVIHHTSGIGAVWAALDRGSNSGATQVVREHERDLCPRADPGTYRYSSANYLLLAAVLESATGTTYGELVTAHVSGSTDADSLVTSTNAAGSLPVGHRFMAGRPVTMSTPYDESGVAYGYLGGSLTDLERVAQGFVGATPALGKPTRDDGVATGSLDRYGAGWRLRDLSDGTRLAWHSGMVPGYVTTVMIWPERDLGLVTLQNASGLGHAESLLAGPIRLASALVPATTLTAQTGPQPLYLATLTTLGALTILTWAAALRGPSGSRRSTIGWSVAAIAMLALVATHLATGSIAGILWRQAWLWAPDAAALTAASGVAVLLSAARALSAGRAASRTHRPARPASRRPT